MKIPNKKVGYIAILFLSILVSCGPNIPKSDYPVEIEKAFNASFDKTWDAVLKVVKMSKGTIITSDKSSGLVTYAIPDKKSKFYSFLGFVGIESKIYINVYLKSNPNANTTTVFLFSKTRIGPYLKEIDRDFYEQTRIGPYLKEIDRDFYEKLKTILGDENG